MKIDDRKMPGPGDPETWGPCTGHPLDPRTVRIEDTAEFEEKATQMFEERVSDFNGFFLESFTEADDSELVKLAALLIQHRNAPSDKAKDLQMRIGSAVIEMVERACEPWDVEVEEAINNERD